jgi:hypothetical protein
VNEALNVQNPVPIVVQLYAFNPYSSDITVNFEVTGKNAQQGTDFTLNPGNSVKIKAGSLTSDTLWVSTIDNDEGAPGSRGFDVTITSTSMQNLRIGLGITEPRNAKVSVNIIDDECSGSPLCIFASTMTNTISGSTVKPVSSVLDPTSGKITFTGDLIDYGPFSSATVTLTLTPESGGATSGTATFGEQEAGSDSDGYMYKFVEIGEGSYDADAGTISVEYEIFYLDGGSWVSWYTVTNHFEVE